MPFLGAIWTDVDTNTDKDPDRSQQNNSRYSSSSITSNKDVKWVAVKRIIIAGHGIKWPNSQRITVKYIELCVIPTIKSRIHIFHVKYTQDRKFKSLRLLIRSSEEKKKRKKNVWAR